MNIEILDEAQKDLIQGFRFCKSQEPGLGAYFLDCLFSDIDSLLVYAGVHAVTYAYHRCFSKRFPFAIYYSLEGQLVRVHCCVRLSQKSDLGQEAFEEYLMA